MPEPSETSILSAVGQFLETLRADRNTQRTYSTGLGSFLHFASQESDLPKPELPLGLFQDDTLERFQGYLTERGYSRFTSRTYMASLSAFLSYLLAHDMLPASFSPVKARARLRQSNRRAPYPAPVPDPALPLIIRYYDEMPLPEGAGREAAAARLCILRSRAIVHTLYSSAGRIAEVASLNRRDVADGRQTRVVVTGKGGKQRFIYFTADALAAISRYVAERQDTHQPLFVAHGRQRGARLSKVSIWETVKKAARALRIDVSPHDFRHYRARQMLDQGAPLEAIQDILGHSDIGTTRKVYAIYSRPSVHEIFERATLSPTEAIARLDQEQGEGNRYPRGSV